jgi:hypothetical protein
MGLKFFALLVAAFALPLPAPDPVTFDASWVPSQPEVLTYRAPGSDASEIYQLAIVKNQFTIQTYINIASRTS